jgi:hypothetical protein
MAYLPETSCIPCPYTHCRTDSGEYRTGLAFPFSWPCKAHRPIQIGVKPFKQISQTLQLLIMALVQQIPGKTGWPGHL